MLYYFCYFSTQIDSALSRTVLLLQCSSRLSAVRDSARIDSALSHTVLSLTQPKSFVHNFHLNLKNFTSFHLIILLIYYLNFILNLVSIHKANLVKNYQIYFLNLHYLRKDINCHIHFSSNLVINSNLIFNYGKISYL